MERTFLGGRVGTFVTYLRVLLLFGKLCPWILKSVDKHFYWKIMFW